MKATSLLKIPVIIAALLGATALYADTMSGTHVLYTPTGDLTAMTQNTGVGTYGGVFLTSGSTWPMVNWLGYADPNNQGLSSSHVVDLFYAGGSGGSTTKNVAEVTVPAGTDAPWYAGYRWVALPKDLTLWYSSWYVLSAQTDGVDLWGDLISNSSGTQIQWDDGAANGYANSYVGNQGGWSRAGREGSSNPPNTQASISDSIFPVANLGYNLPIPEPGCLGLLGVGAAMLVLRRGRNR